MRLILAIPLALLIPACGGTSGQARVIAISPTPQVEKRTVLFFGDSITRGSIRSDRGLSTEFNSVNWGVGGLGVYFAYRMQSNVLRDNPGAQLVAICFGTNDAYNMRVSVADFESLLGLMVNDVRFYGREAIIPTIPYSPLPELANVPLYNAAIARVIAAKGCQTGPDVYTWFLNNPGELDPDLTHPNHNGYVSINRLWAEVLAP